MQEFGLKSAHVSCLFYLYRHDEGLTASQLSALCDEDKGALSRSLDFLEDNGYIICEHNQDKKKYRARLKLTEKGQVVGEKIFDITESAVELGSNGISEKEREVLYKSLETISENLKKICDNYGVENGNKNNN